MRKTLAILLFAPLLAHPQQPVKPVISPDYLSLINGDSLPAINHTTGDSSEKYLLLKQPFTTQSRIKTIRERNGSLTIIPGKTKWLTIGGNYSFSAAAKSINTQPSLQNEYVQGESSNGSLTAEGPETNQVLSYGPSIQSLQYGGFSNPAKPFNNSIFRTGHMTGQSISLLANIRSASWRPLWAFAVKAGANSETTVIPDNRNTLRNISMSTERSLEKYSIKGGYSYFSSSFSNDNSNGFLNRVYQNALQTPISFSDAQGATLTTGGQRSYSNQADNPWFLLSDNGHFDNLVQQTANLAIQKNQGNVTYGVINSFDAVANNSNQSLKPGTVSFPAGLLYTRKQTDDHYASNGYLAYRFNYDDNLFSSIARLNYIYNNEAVKISYPANNYAYQRSANDGSFTFNSTYNGYRLEAGFNAGNKFYLSNTSPHDRFFLPELSGFIGSSHLLDDRLNARLTASYNSFCSEPRINQSLSAFMLTQLIPQEASRFIPSAEVLTFHNLSPMQHREVNSGIQVQYMNLITFHADFSIRDTRDNVFPSYENNQLVVKNIADTRYKGYELQLQYKGSSRNPKKIFISTSISFYKFSNIVTRIQDGYENHPVAGFSTIYKALVKGQPSGVIMGNDYLRDAAGEVLIGQDGFPLVNNQPSVIGNPTPDYTLKLSHVVTWRAFSIDIDWEYRKGGDVWNGTAAALDYYGRSAISGAKRNITGYVFPGMLQNGGKNNIPVAFYNPALPVGQNRWVRYGYTGVASSYIQKGDNIRIHNLSLSYDIRIKDYLQRIRLTAYAENLLLWSAYKGADPNQLLYDQPGSGGLDFFNLPSIKTYGLSASIQL